MELEANFATEEACRAYLARLRWPTGFRCSRCGLGKSWPARAVLLECAACGCQTSVTAGTIFQDTRTPLPVWFRDERDSLCGIGLRWIPHNLDSMTLDKAVVENAVQVV
jgi:hypothetical protein